jgi:hypothetical protein
VYLRVMVCRVETLRALHSGYVLDDPARIGIEYTSGQLCMYMQPIPVEIQKSTAARPPNRLIHRPAVFFRHLCLIAFSIPYKCFKNNNFHFLYILKNYVNLTFFDLESCNAGTAFWLAEFTWHRSECSCESLWRQLMERLSAS